MTNFSRLQILGLFFFFQINGFTAIGAEDSLNSSDKFESLPMGTPTCTFLSSVTRVQNGNKVSLYQNPISASNEQGFTPALKKSCNDCIADVKKAVEGIRRKFTFFEAKCIFRNCGIGKSKAPAPMDDQTFRSTLNEGEEGFYCIKRN